jgi:uncharacterized membrane protein YciS (DUF1049 family)
MFCPRCGHNGSSDQRFCRSCGFELTKVSELLQDSDPESLVQGNPDERLVRQRQLKVVGNIAVLGTISLAMLAFLAGVLWLMISGQMPMAAGVAILLFLSGLSVGALCLGLASLKPRLSARAREKSYLKENAATTGLLETGVEQPLASVTEHTTELLVPKK